tara:strand:- start:671 stop:1489 length:819 start_codon:yes stop_codon:yes gene_type:complete
MSENSAPLISFLIPAYNYRAGVERVLNILLSCPAANVEIIVSDDSDSAEIDEMVARVKLLKDPFRSLRYLRHESTGNAVDNWNFLLSLARGRFCQFIHHDEYPEVSSYVKILTAELEENFDVSILRYRRLFDNHTDIPTTDWFRAVVVRNKNFLLYKNVVGSPSNIVFRREIAPKFDSSLKELVDVEFYLALIDKADAVKISQITMNSEINYSGRIYASIKDGIEILAATERLSISEKRPITLFLPTRLFLTLAYYFIRILSVFRRQSIRVG